MLTRGRSKSFATWL